ncbi:hypothetical protein AB0L30_38810 [Microbispora rosea]|uniref:hypothetical protein n=1 Tax=Microbispora rosea TaxID=58117 RepID=UPI00343009BF
MAAGLRYAADHGAKVVFIEEGRGNAANTTKLAQSVDYALRKNVVIVAEASRLVTYGGKPTPPESLSYPVALPGVIGVGAIDDKGRPLAKMSARNSTVLLSAPGTRLNVTGDGNQSRWYIYGPPPRHGWSAPPPSSRRNTPSSHPRGWLKPSPCQYDTGPEADTTRPSATASPTRSKHSGRPPG